MSDTQKIQRILSQTGAYLCPHFKIQKVLGNKKGCCGNNQTDFIPICSLTNLQCSGVPQCLKLNVQIKSEYIKQWKKDLTKNKKIEPHDYIK